MIALVLNVNGRFKGSGRGATPNIFSFDSFDMENLKGHGWYLEWFWIVPF